MISLADRFIELAQPDENGYSRWVTIEEWEKIGLKHDNGSQWCQKDRGVGTKYFFEKEYGIINGHRRVVAIRLTGKINNKKNSEFRDHNVPVNIYNAVMKDAICPVLGTSNNLEWDHCDGRYTKTHNELTESDGQPLSKPANCAKRTHCLRCRKTGKRFDAKKLGFSYGWVEGDENYTKELGCRGCYYYKVAEFHRKISMNFKGD